MSHRNIIAKFLLAFVLAFAVITPFQPQEAEAASPVAVYVNGQRLAKNGEVVSGSTLVPMRAIFEALGATVQYFGDTQSISAFDPTTNKIMSMTVNDKNMFCADNSEFSKYASNPTSQATINFVLEHTSVVSVPPTVISGNTMVPVRVVSESLNCKVDWNGKTQTVTINR